MMTLVKHRGPTITVTCFGCGISFERSRSRPRLERYFHSHDCYLSTPRSADTRRKTSTALKGRPSNNPLGNGGACKGRPATPAQLEGLRIGWEKMKLGGEHTPGWKGGLTEKNHGLRMTVAYRKFRASILAVRDTCEAEGCTNKERLELDHIEPVSRNPARVLDITNVRVLCHGCHVLTPTYAGRANRTVI